MGWVNVVHGGSCQSGVDSESGEILGAVVTTNDVGDCEVLPDILEQIDQPIEQVSGDGGYDTKGCYDTISQRGAKAVIPPRSNAKIQQHTNSETQPHKRDENLRRVSEVGRRQWKQETGYHRRSLSETAPPDWGQAAQIALESIFPNVVVYLLLLNIKRLAHLARSSGFDIEISRCKI